MHKGESEAEHRAFLDSQLVLTNLLNPTGLPDSCSNSTHALRNLDGGQFLLQVTIPPLTETNLPFKGEAYVDQQSMVVGGSDFSCGTDLLWYGSESGKCSTH